MIPFDRVLSDLSVVPRSGDWYRVLLPGWGGAWVHQDSATVLNAPVNSASHPMIEGIEIRDMTAENAFMTLDLLELIGRDIRRLDVHHSSLAMHMDAWIVRLFQICPNLEDLTLRTFRFSDETIFDQLYPSSKCCVKRLTVYRVSRGSENPDHRSDDQHYDDVDDVFTSILRDKAHAIASRLEELTYVSYVMANCGVDGPDDALELLANNDHLRVLNLVYTQLGVDRSNRESYLRKFAKLDGKLLPIQRGPLAMKRKLAFLSVVNQREGAAQQLDTVVIANIFGFAAKCVKRRVQVHFEI